VLVAAGGAPLGDVRAVGVGRAHACALVSGGELRCWGFNSDGQLGDGTAATRPAPVPVLVAAGGAPLAGVQAVSVGAVHTCAVVEGGQVRCWGDNSSGQIGDDSTTDRPSPVTVVSEPGGDPLAGVQTVEVGSHHSCALLTGGELRCWGQNNFGQLGDGTEGDRLTPTPVVSEAGGAPLTGVQAVSVGDEHTCALLAGGELRCWGRNDDGRLGNGVTAAEATSVPVPVLKADGAPFAGVRGVAAADKHTCALLDGVDVQCWGANGLGQLGDGTTTDRIKPAPVTFP
jgi:alpha-tubulin suppressor-like RCC1 family protein